MMSRVVLVPFLLAVTIATTRTTAVVQKGPSKFKVVAFYTGVNDQAHISFVREANRWFPELGKQHHFSYEATTDWSQLNAGFLSNYEVVLFLDTRPTTPRSVKHSGVHGERWRLDGIPLGRLCADAVKISAELGLVHNEFSAPGRTSATRGGRHPPCCASNGRITRRRSACRTPSSRLRASGTGGRRICERTRTFRSCCRSIHRAFRWDGTEAARNLAQRLLPVVWTNTRYRMIYMNMGHNDIDYENETNKELSSTFAEPLQNQLIAQALAWLGSRTR